MIEPFLQNKDYASMLKHVVLRYYHAQKHRIVCNFKYWSWILLKIRGKFLFTFHILGRKSEERK